MRNELMTALINIPDNTIANLPSGISNIFWIQANYTV